MCAVTADTDIDHPLVSGLRPDVPAWNLPSRIHSILIAEIAPLPFSSNSPLSSTMLYAADQLKRRC